MKEQINTRIEEYTDDLAEKFIEDLRRVLSTGISSQELVRLFLGESVNVSIASLTKTDKRIHSAVFAKVNKILSEKGIFVKPAKKDGFNCRVSLTGNYPPGTRWFHLENSEFMLEDRYLIENGKKAFDEITEKLVENIKESAIFPGERAVKLRLGEAVHLKDINVLLPIRSETARRKIISAAVRKLKEVEIAAEFKNIKFTRREEGRYDCKIHLINSAS